MNLSGLRMLIYLHENENSLGQFVHQGGFCYASKSLQFSLGAIFFRGKNKIQYDFP